MAEILRVRRENVRLTEATKVPEGWRTPCVVAEVEGRLYSPDAPAPSELDQYDSTGLEYSNRAKFFAGRFEDPTSIRGPVVDSAAMLRRELVFLRGNDGQWYDLARRNDGWQLKEEN